MSYTPTSKNAQRILDQLRKKPREKSPWQKLVDAQIPRYKRDDLREVLIGMVCPIVCVGEINEAGWHAVCERHADDALAALFGTTTAAGETA